MSLRRTPMPRGSVKLRRVTPLRASAPLARRTPLVAKSAPKPVRVKAAVPRDVRVLLVARSGGDCEIQIPGCRGEAVQAHHRITTKAGGRHGAAKVEHDRLSDLLHVCWYCHALVTDRDKRIAASLEAGGWALKERQVPSQEPVLYRGRLVFLDDVGGVHEYERGAA